MNPKNLICTSDFQNFKGDFKLNNQFQLLLYLLALKIEGESVETFEAGVISLKSPLKGIIPLKNKGETPLDFKILDEVQHFLKSVITEIFDKKKSFVSL